MSKSWRDFPCKDCLVNKVCNELCFEIPRSDFTEVIRLNRRELGHATCAACGEKLIKANPDSPFVFKCIECNNIHQKIFNHITRVLQT